ncbi:MAG: D-tyrosyl-tRNA(Tyr) deacylase [Acaryochloris sp. RU_4_1]|nr:D-tyrosyl-tRNA(Tyr) deacylase [Acaryochloris sp. RU_4_1]NJR53179.1 D-tyrosyl-tRNA(Tyr) deacylase [Acaryochloris sp. CRU_2_0]
MRIVLQRVKASRVEVSGQVIGQIKKGLNLLVGISTSDTEVEIAWLARKCLELRIFSDSLGKLSQSIVDIQGAILVISQFTLYGDCRRGRRPSFDQAAPSPLAEKHYQSFVAKLKESGLQVETGQFGAMMTVFIENDGPVTLILQREASQTSL